MSERNREFVTERKQLAYSGDFKTFVHENSGLLKKAKELIDTMIEKKLSEAAEDDIYAQSIPAATEAFCVSAGGKDFFVKVENASKFHGAYREFKSNEDAMQKLHGINDVEVIPAYLGYTSKDREYFVAPWQSDVILLSTALLNPSSELTSQEKERFQKLYNEIVNTYLKDFTDVSMNNMFFDLKRQKILVFDLHRYSDEK